MFRPGKVGATVSPEAYPGFNVAVELRNDMERFLVFDSHVTLMMRHPERGLVEVARGHHFSPKEAHELSRMKDAMFYYRVKIDPWTFHQIEQLRAGAAADFELVVTVLSAKIDESGAPPHRIQFNVPLTIDKAVWVETYIRAFGYGNYELWEVRFPISPRHSELQHERDLLRRAIQDYDKGEYEHAYGNCRKMVESLSNRDKELNLIGILGEQEWKRANSYLSIAVHSENEIPRKIIRADAEFAISLTKAIYKRVADALLMPDDKK